MERIICPLLKVTCLSGGCAWWDPVSGCCCMVSLGTYVSEEREHGA